MESPQTLVFDDKAHDHNHDHQAPLPDTEADNETQTKRPIARKRFASDICLLICILIMILWPWVFFGVVKAKHGIQMSNQLSDNVARHPHQVGAIVTLIGTINRLIATLLFGKAVVRLGQELIAKNSQPEVTVFGVSALLAFRHMTMVWGVRQWRQLAKGKGRLAVVVMLLASLGALALIPSGTANLITPGQFNKTAELRGTELDFTSGDPRCSTWLALNQVTNDCDWQDYKGTPFTTCLGENQMLDVLDSGRANMFSAMGSKIKNETSSLNQLGAEGGIRFLGSPRGVLPIGPDGVPAFDSLQTQANPFADSAIRGGIVSYNYTLKQQGLETMVNCSYNSTSTPIIYDPIENLNSSILIATHGTCDAADGLEPVLKDVVEYTTLSTNNTLTYWACKQLPSQGSPDPTYFVYLRGRVNYRRSIGNITCRVSPMRARNFDVAYHSLLGYFTSQASQNNLEESSQRPTYSPFTDSMLVGLGNIIWEGQNWAANLFAEAVFSMGVKNFGVSPSLEPSDTQLRLFEAMIQGVLEYEGTYSRLVYSLGLRDPPPTTCLRTVNGTVSYSVRGWYIDNSGAQAGLLMPMFLINLTSLGLLFACFIMGQFRYTYDFDATDSMSLLTALVVNVRRGRDGKVEWHNKVHYEVDRARD